jgi:uncharacterized SAM-binding protein YcdF (DUF218 family)
MADPTGPNKRAPPQSSMPASDLRDTDRHLVRDVRHSLGITALAVLLSGGLLYLACLARVCWVAMRSGQDPGHGEQLLVFGKKLADGAPDEDYRRRLQHAHALAQRHPQRPLILLGGGPAGATEAEAGLHVLHELGLPPEVPVLLEDQSLDTLQNLRNARDMLAEHPPGRLLLLSNRYHLARCHSLARLLGMDALPCAAEPAFRLREQGLVRLALEAAYLCWLEVGAAWARLIGHRRMIERVS